MNDVLANEREDQLFVLQRELNRLRDLSRGRLRYDFDCDEDRRIEELRLISRMRKIRLYRDDC
jgi:hypothetical protein